MSAEHLRKPGRSRAGFTLVELLVVIGVIALLIMILVPSLIRAREMARRAACAANVHAIAAGLVSYAQDNDDAVPLGCWLAYNKPSQAIRRTNYFISYQRPEDIPNGCPVPDGQLGMLIQPDNEYIDHGEDFYCPSAKDDMWKYNNPDPTPYPDKTTFEQMHSTVNLWWDHKYRISGIGGRIRLGYGVRPVIGWPTNGMPPWHPSNLDTVDKRRHNNGKLPRMSTPTPLNFNGQRMMISFNPTDAMVADVTNNPKRVNRFHGDGVNVGWFDGSVHWFDRDGFNDVWQNWPEGGYASDATEDNCHYRAERDSSTGKVTITGVWAEMSGFE